MNFPTVQETIKAFEDIVSTTELADDSLDARRSELTELTHEELVEMIISFEKRNTNKGVGVGDLARAILQHPDYITLSNGEVAEVCRELIPGSQTSHKSIASYVSKKREEWALPDRIQVRRKKV